VEWSICIGKVTELVATRDSLVDHFICVASIVVDGKSGIIEGLIRDKDLSTSNCSEESSISTKGTSGRHDGGWKERRIRL